MYPPRTRPGTRALLTCALLAATACGSSGAPAPRGATTHDHRNAAGPTPTPALGDLRRVGTVHFATSCDPAVHADFARALALLHSFFYEEARRVFTAVTQRDARCAIAHWGVAMTWYHPLWAPPTTEELEAGRTAIGRARAIGAGTRRERDYIDALAAFFAAGTSPDGPVGQGCHGPTDHLGRATLWARAMGDLRREHPDDVEAAAFHALALLGSAKPGDRSQTRQRQAAAILEPLWAAHRDHPGAIHYLIHAYDTPTLADRGLPAARAYARIAPWVPHALHMPSHIFTRLGMWRDSVQSNLASVDAARAYERRYHPGAAGFDELHALDYLVYAYLQTARDDDARAAVEHVTNLKRTHPEVEFAAAHAIGSIPARYALERRDWAAAAALTVPPRPFWAVFPFSEARIHLARALGKARTGDAAGARAAIARLVELRDALTDPRFGFFKAQVGHQIGAARAWLARLERRDDEAVALLRAAADGEDALGTHPVSPGPVVVARELLGELLLELDRPQEAVAAFETSLRRSPGRLNALGGAARAAERAGDRQAARRYYETFVAQTEGGGGRAQELAHARAFLGR